MFWRMRNDIFVHICIHANLIQPRRKEEEEVEAVYHSYTALLLSCLHCLEKSWTFPPLTTNINFKIGVKSKGQ